MATATQPQTRYRLKLKQIEACNCNHGCGCQFSGFPDNGNCEFVIGWEVDEGKFGNVDLAGLRFAVACKYPKAIHQGNGHVALFVDPSAKPDQVTAIATVMSGKLGGMPWEALAGTVSRFEGPILKPVEIKTAPRRSTVRVPGILELVQTPYTNPVSGKESEVHIVYPKGGFFWDDGDICTTTSLKVSYGDLKFEHPGCFSSSATAKWSNQ